MSVLGLSLSRLAETILDTGDFHARRRLLDDLEDLANTALRPVYGNPAFSKVDEFSENSSTLENAGFPMLRLRLPGGRQLIWMLLFVVLPEWLLVLSYQRQNPLFFAQFIRGVSISRARLGICARNTFHKICYGHKERQGKCCWMRMKPT